MSYFKGDLVFDIPLAKRISDALNINENHINYSSKWASIGYYPIFDQKTSNTEKVFLCAIYNQALKETRIYEHSTGKLLVIVRKMMIRLQTDSKAMLFDFEEEIDLESKSNPIVMQEAEIKQEQVENDQNEPMNHENNGDAEEGGSDEQTTSDASNTDSMSDLEAPDYQSEIQDDQENTENIVEQPSSLSSSSASTFTDSINSLSSPAQSSISSDSIMSSRKVIKRYVTANVVQKSNVNAKNLFLMPSKLGNLGNLKIDIEICNEDGLLPFQFEFLQKPLKELITPGTPPIRLPHFSSRYHLAQIRRLESWQNSQNQTRIITRTNTYFSDLKIYHKYRVCACADINPVNDDLYIVKPDPENLGQFIVYLNNPRGFSEVDKYAVIRLDSNSSHEEKSKFQDITEVKLTRDGHMLVFGARFEQEALKDPSIPTTMLLTVFTEEIKKAIKSETLKDDAEDSKARSISQLKAKTISDVVNSEDVHMMPLQSSILIHLPSVPHLHHIRHFKSKSCGESDEVVVQTEPAFMHDKDPVDTPRYKVLDIIEDNEKAVDKSLLTSVIYRWVIMDTKNGDILIGIDQREFELPNILIH